MEVGLLNNFISSIFAVEGLSKNTIENYERDLKQLLKYLATNNIEITEASTENLKKYLSSLAKNYSNRTIARHISSIKHFYDFLQLEKIIKNNPSTLLEQRKIEEYLPNFLEENDIEKILNEAKKDKTDHGVKFYCMLTLLYATAMRVSELVELKMSNLEKKFKLNSRNDLFDLEPHIKVVGKGEKTRIIPIDSESVRILKQYIVLREKLLNGQHSNWLFTTRVVFSKNNEKNTVQKISKKDGFTSRQVFARLLKELCKKTGVNPTKLSPHTIRHSVATIMLKNGANLRFIQEFLGHSDISTTQIYTHLNDKKKEEAIKKYHPFSGKKRI